MTIIEKIQEIVNGDKIPSTVIIMLMLTELKIIKLAKLVVFFAFLIGFSIFSAGLAQRLLKILDLLIN